jgi:hypothetical protein
LGTRRAHEEITYHSRACGSLPGMALSALETDFRSGNVFDAKGIKI